MNTRRATPFAKLAVHCGRLICALSLLATAVPVKAVERRDETPRTETIRFSSKAATGALRHRRIRLNATLYMPRMPSFPMSAVVIAPSSGGIEEEREIYYAKVLSRSGIAALLVDSFTPRGVRSTLYNQNVFTEWDMELDVFAALELLSRDTRFRKDRIGIMGVSKGGTVAMNTGLTVRREWAGMGQLVFAAHIAISPDCTWITRNPANTGAPVLFMLAALDDQTLPQPCLRQAARMRLAGNAYIETKVYEGAHHAWEELGPRPVYDRRIENYSNCRVWIEDSGEMFSARTGELVPEANWHDWARRSCMTFGATCCGGTAKLKKAATADIIAFLRKHDF